MKNLHESANDENSKEEQAGETQEFAKIYQKYGENAESRWVEIYNDANNLVFQSNDYHGALPLINFIISVQPENALNHWLCAIIHHNIGNTQRAKNAIEESLKINPNNMISCYDASRIFLDNNDLDKAKEYAKKACEMDQDNGFNEYQLAKILVIQGLFDEAHKHIDQCIELEHFLDHSYYLKGHTFRLQKNFKEAAEALVKSINQSTPSDITKQEINLLLLQIDDNKEIDQEIVKKLQNSLS